jgi:hypothetical protein
VRSTVTVWDIMHRAGRFSEEYPGKPKLSGTKENISIYIKSNLAEITFRPHSLNECSFTAVILADHGMPESSFGQVAKLFENNGYVWKVVDFMIMLRTEDLFLLVGFSGAIRTASEACCMYRDATVSQQTLHHLRTVHPHCLPHRQRTPRHLERMVAYRTLPPCVLIRFSILEETAISKED